MPVLLSVPVPSVVEPSLKVTEPVGTPARRDHANRRREGDRLAKDRRAGG